MINEALILQLLTEIYLDENNFAGTTVSDFASVLEVSEIDILESVMSLAKQGKVFTNPSDLNSVLREHESSRKESTKEGQDSEESVIPIVVVFPSTTHLREVVNKEEYSGRPFMLKLALGESQLKPYFFDLRVLEFYRNDPRYHYKCTDVGGMIFLHDSQYESDSTNPSDKICLKTFGFAYDDEGNRAVVVYLWYLSRLTPKHQRIWEASLLKGNYKLHPDYFRGSIKGEFPQKISIFDAFLEEMRLVNEMSTAMGRDPFFREEFSNESKPRQFGFIIRPTYNEFYDFVLLLDKMLSENINKNFFSSDILFEEEEERKDGKIAVKQKLSITWLSDWLNLCFRTANANTIVEMISTFRKIRKLRQRPAHKIAEDQFDQIYFKQQRELIIEAYKAVRNLRLILSNHPNCKDVKIYPMLEKGDIWTY